MTFRGLITVLRWHFDYIYSPMNRLLITFTCIGLAVSTYAQNKPQFAIASTSFKKDTISIVSTGAQSNGDFVNTIAINNAIQKMHAKGGGVVLIPSGQWLTGPIVLKSNVNLHLNKGAFIVFTSDFAQYPLVVSSFEGVDAARCQSPISAEKQTNIAITGEGVLNGNGIFWRPIKKDKLSEAEWKRHLQLYGGALTEDKKLGILQKQQLKLLQEKILESLPMAKLYKILKALKIFYARICCA